MVSDWWRYARDLGERWLLWWRGELCLEGMVAGRKLAGLPGGRSDYWQWSLRGLRFRRENAGAWKRSLRMLRGVEGGW